MVDQISSVTGAAFSIFANLSEAHATLAAASLAVGAAFVGFRENQRRQRNEFTLDLILSFSQNARLAPGHELVETAFREGLQITELKGTPDAQYDSYRMYLSMAENVAYAYRRRFIDHQYIDDQLGHRLHKTYHVSRDFIDKRRENDPEYYVELVRFAHSGKRSKFFRDEFEAKQRSNKELSSA